MYIPSMIPFQLFEVWRTTTRARGLRSRSYGMHLVEPERGPSVVATIEGRILADALCVHELPLVF